MYRIFEEKKWQADVPITESNLHSLLSGVKTFTDVFLVHRWLIAAYVSDVACHSKQERMAKRQTNFI
eukprot:scaffold232692_cov30-Prasinocladus_malaysianus.AAC.2